MSLRAVAAQAGAQGAGRIIALAINLASFGLLLAALAPEAFGYVSLALALEYIVATAAALGLDKVVLRRLSVGEADGGDLTCALVLRGAVGLLAACVGSLAVIASGAGTPLRDALLVAMAGQLLAPLNVLQQVLRARVRLVPFAVADVAGSGITLALLALFAVDGLSAAEAVAATILANLAVRSALAVAALRLVRLRRPEAPRARTRLLLREGRSLAVGDGLVVGYYRMDVIALGAVVGGAAVGTYGAAYRFVDIAMYAQTILIGAFFPSMARAWRAQTGLRELIERLTAILAGVAALLVVVVATAGPAVIRAFGGTAYGDTDLLIAVLMGAVLVMFVNRLLVQALIAGGFGRRQVVCWLGGIAGAALTFPAAASWGPEGVAVAVLGGELAVLSLAWWQVGRAGLLPRPGGNRMAIGFVTIAIAVLLCVPLAGSIRWTVGGTAGLILTVMLLRQLHETHDQ